VAAACGRRVTKYAVWVAVVVGRAGVAVRAGKARVTDACACGRAAPVSAARSRAGAERAGWVVVVVRRTGVAAGSDEAGEADARSIRLHNAVVGAINGIAELAGWAIKSGVAAAGAATVDALSAESIVVARRRRTAGARLAGRAEKSGLAIVAIAYDEIRIAATATSAGAGSMPAAGLTPEAIGADWVVVVVDVAQVAIGPCVAGVARAGVGEEVAGAGSVDAGVERTGEDLGLCWPRS
jgi:hypothetical protein